MDKIDSAIERLRLAAQMSEIYYRKPLIVTTSGGKDSDVCLALAKISGINYEVQHNHTTADAPETVYHVRDTFRRLELDGVQCTINWPTYKENPVTMWSLIPQKLMPPTRLVRYCCDVLKEGGGAGRMITTGVRWAESAKRKNSRGIYEKVGDKKTRIILSNDNDDTRTLFENCKLKAKRVCNPIVDWTDNEVWDFISFAKVPVNILYGCGFSRVGCIGCPMAGKQGRMSEFHNWPTYERAYIRTFQKMLDVRREKGLQTEWETGLDVFHWWMEDGVLNGQVSMNGF